MKKNNLIFIIVSRDESVHNIDGTYLARYLADGLSWYTSESDAWKGLNDGDAFDDPREGKIVRFEIGKGFLVKQEGKLK